MSLVLLAGGQQTRAHEVTLGAGADGRIDRLRLVNAVLGLLHAAQAVAVLLLSTTAALPVTAAYLAGPPGAEPGETVILYEARVAWGVAGFLAISTVAHWLIAGPLFTRYAAGLRAGRNIFRWIEYSLSASIMIVLIAQLTGIGDAAALIALFGVNASMIFYGWIQEVYERPGSGGWLPFILGCVAGIVPWVAIAVYLFQIGGEGSATPPGFVYGIFVSLFLFFNSFAVNQWAQYRRSGRWADYLTGETTYMVLSLVAKSALAWQVFAGALAG